MVGSGIWSQAVCFLCWCRWQESGLNRRENVFTLNVLHTEFFINFVLSVSVYKDNAATNCTKKVYSHQLLLYNHISYMRFQVLTTASMKMIVFSEVDRRFRGAC
jgi:hypothetical protein